jgi:pyruvate-formate lyase
MVGALPSGRLAKYSFSDGISPTHGSDTNGPFAVLKSVSATNPVSVHGGNVLNMRLVPDTFDSEEGFQQTMALLRAFVDESVTEIQFNVVSNETLRDAQDNPENYKDLMIRVAGYSAYFTQLSEPFQDAIINRTEHAFLAEIEQAIS